jgi:DNA topoisomerase-3
MKRFADSIARQKGIKPPRGYVTSGSICRAFLDQHAPKKDGGETLELGPKPASPAQILCTEKIAQQKGGVIPEEAKASSTTISSWIDSNRGTKRGMRGRKTASNSPKSPAA